MDDQEKIIEKLKPRFVALWNRCLDGRDEADPRSLWNELIGHYTQSIRHYHCVGHLLHCLEQHDRAAVEMDDADAVEMAIWFHDVVFDIQSSDNERRSAELFRRVAAGRLGSAFVEKVFRMILVTDHHSPPATNDEAFVADIDLSALALPWERYLRDTESLRRENGELSDDRYHASHRRFLGGLIKRPRIFQSDFFHHHCECDARRNIERYLGYLEAAGRVPAPADNQ